ncbi:MAG: hypothetical protein D6731_08295 [Planctomycetota bacterium]|nr:MAG: hypothetical protein D6731_08295 [Planctomycetota bacterium]
MSDPDALFEQAAALPLPERQRLVRRLAWRSNMAAGPALISLDPGSPRVFVVAGALGFLFGLGLLVLGLLLAVVGCPHPAAPSGPGTIGVGLAVCLLTGSLLLLGLQLWDEQDRLAEAER